MKKPLRLITCANQRPGAEQGSSVESGNLGLTRRIETIISAEGLEVPLVRRECLRRRGPGSAMRIAPAAPFFTEFDDPKLPLIIVESSAFVEIQDGSGS